MTRGRLASRLTRHPWSVVLLIAALLAVSGVGLMRSAVDATLPTGPPASSAADRYSLPEPTQRPPGGRVDEVHRALHALGRACERLPAAGRRAAVRRYLASIEAFARDFPSGGFRIDDENGTTLTLLVVVWDELKSCDPSLVRRVERLIPPRYRGG